MGKREIISFLRLIAGSAGRIARRTGRIICISAAQIKSRTKTEDRAGLYVTVIFHLVIIIVMLAGTVSSAISGDSSYLFDFSHQEEAERLEEEEAFKDEISRRLDRLLNDAGDVDLPPVPDVRNIAVESSSLTDDRNTDAEKLYADAARLQAELQNGYRQDFAVQDMSDETVDTGDTQEDASEKKPVYKGPSVASWTLDGRKPVTLNIPAYRCIGGGEVSVIITVDNSGRVVNARIMDDISSDDECLRKYAVRAARLSRFTASSSAPSRQTGEIVYRFIAQ